MTAMPSFRALKSGDPPPPKPAVVERARRRVNKEDVLREAVQLFAERGYDGFSMGDLAERTNLRKASLFHHFPTKEALYQRVLQSIVQELGTRLTSATTAERTFVERLDMLNEALTTVLGTQVHIARLLVGESVYGGSSRRPAVEAAVDGVLVAARTFVEDGQREGIFERSLDPSHVVLTAIGAYVLPFATHGLVERFLGTPPGHPALVSARAAAVREQLRRMLVVRRDPPASKTKKKKKGKRASS